MQKSTAISLAANVVLAAVVIPLEGRDLPLSEEQRARLLSAAIEHRQVFIDAYADAATNAEQGWMHTPRKPDILNADQMASIAELRETRIALSQLGSR